MRNGANPENDDQLNELVGMNEIKRMVTKTPIITILEQEKLAESQEVYYAKLKL